MRNDMPFDRFSAMIDCNNAVPSLGELKRFARQVKDFGYDSLFMNMGDTYEIPEEPLWGLHRGRYSKAELKEIDVYCRDIGIELVPCIQTLGHLDRIFIWDPLYLKYLDTEGVILVGEEQTYELIDNMFRNLTDCFSTRTFHVGMDEAYLVGCGRYYNRHGKADRMELLLSHLARVAEIGKKYGLTLLIWSDMFFHLLNNGKYEGEIPACIRESLPDNVRLVLWNYEEERESVYDGLIKTHLALDKNAWFAGSAIKHYGFHSSNEQSFRAIAPAVRSCIRGGVRNFLVTMWADNGGECPPEAVLPALLYAVRCARGDCSVENAKAEFERLTGESWDDFLLCDFKLPKGLRPYRLCASGAKEMLYSDCFMGKFDSTVTGTGAENAMYADLADKFAAAKKRSREYAYMFDSYEKLCRVLSRKYELGYRTRMAYRRGDRAALSALVSEYDATIRLLDEFVPAFRKMWFTLYKPHNFDVHEIRLGGLSARLASCRDRLKAYLGGEIDAIEELSDPIVNCLVGDEEKLVPRYNRYAGIATLNRL